jgi:hypothetical protein
MFIEFTMILCSRFYSIYQSRLAIAMEQNQTIFLKKPLKRLNIHQILAFFKVSYHKI